jgi:lipopolysaccharide export system protein LptC
MNRVIARPDVATARSYWTMSRTDAERAFRAARQHSTRVRSLRIVLPAAIIVAVAGLIIWSWANPARVITKAPKNPADVVVSGTKITMEAPRMSGFTRDSRGYEFTATAASQDISKPDIVEMKNVRANMQMADKSTAVVTARDGVYDSKNEILKLGKEIMVVSSTGYKAWLSDATIDVRTSNLVTDQPVEVQMLQGTLNAQRLEIKEAGELLLFDGGVRMNLKLNTPARAVPEPKPVPEKPAANRRVKTR